jgi:hypothetical protein
MDIAELAAAEALSDARVRPVTTGELAAEVVAHYPETELDVDAVSSLAPEALDAARRDRAIEWAALSLTYGEVMDAFAAYCRDLEDIEVLSVAAARLEIGWRQERSVVELRAGFLFCERLVGHEPVLLLGDLRPAAATRFVESEALRAKIALYDLARLEKINAVRSSAFVYFEWFLRDRYGVKLLPAPSFTRGLIDRGIISLGMG